MRKASLILIQEIFLTVSQLINNSPILGVALGVAPGHAGVVAALGVGRYEGVWAVWLAGVVIGCDGVIIGVIIGVPIGYKY